MNQIAEIPMRRRFPPIKYETLKAAEDSIKFLLGEHLALKEEYSTFKTEALEKFATLEALISTGPKAVVSEIVNKNPAGK